MQQIVKTNLALTSICSPSPLNVRLGLAVRRHVYSSLICRTHARTHTHAQKHLITQHKSQIQALIALNSPEHFSRGLVACARVNGLEHLAVGCALLDDRHQLGADRL